MGEVKQHPPTQIVLSPVKSCSNISHDAAGFAYACIPGVGVQRLKPGSAPAWVDLGQDLAKATATAAVTPDGGRLYVDTTNDGIWEHTIGGGPASNKRIVEPGELGEVRDAGWMPSTVLCSGKSFFFWRVKEQRLHLYAMDWTDKQVQLAYMGGRAGAGRKPSWALDVTARILYLKPEHNEKTMLCIQLLEGLTVKQHTSTQLLQVGDSICGTASNGSIPTCALFLLYVWKAGPLVATSSRGGSDSGRESKLAGSYFADQLESLTWGQECKFFGLHLATADVHGWVWVHDCGRDGDVKHSSIRCVFAALPPPAHLAALRQPSLRELWTLGGQGSRGSSQGALGADLGQLLASGEGADMVLITAGGQRTPAHSLVLHARCEWFRRRASSGMRGAARAARGSSSSREQVEEVHLQEHPAAVVHALLAYLYTGSVDLWGGDGPGAQGPSRASRSTAAAEAGGSGKYAGSGRSSAKRQRVDNSSQQHQKGAAAEAPASAAAAATAAGEGAAAASAAEPPYLLLAQLLHAASVFQVPRLHAECLELAGARLDVHGALPWLVYGHEHGEQQLKQLALGYAATHYTEIRAAQPVAVEGLKKVDAQLVLELMHARDART